MGDPLCLEGHTERRGGAYPRVRVEAFTNHNFSSRYEGYRPGDPLELCHEADRPDLEGLDSEDAAQAWPCPVPARRVAS